ncbi:hypothetical protein Tco_1108587 [Tanacetum coccineum]
MHDRWSWSLNASGDFTVRSVRNHMDDVLLPKSDVPTRWVTMIPVKINILGRLAWIDYLLGLISLPVAWRFSRSYHKVCRWWELDISSFNSYLEWFNWLSNARIAKCKEEILEGIFGELVVGELVGKLVVGDLVGELVVGELIVGDLMVGELMCLLFLFGILAS